MFHIVLYRPEIPPNTGNIIRLCANTSAKLHIIKPISFELDDKRLRRAGLDYHEFAHVKAHESMDAFFTDTPDIKRVFACSTKGSVNYDQPNYEAGDVFLFGPETKGLPDELRSAPLVDQCITIPMLASSRSLNLSNAAAVILFEGLRQLEFNYESFHIGDA